MSNTYTTGETITRTDIVRIGRGKVDYSVSLPVDPFDRNNVEIENLATGRHRVIPAARLTLVLSAGPSFDPGTAVAVRGEAADGRTVFATVVGRTAGDDGFRTVRFEDGRTAHMEVSDLRIPTEAEVNAAVDHWVTTRTADVPADYDPEQTYAEALDYVREVRPELVDEPATLAELEAARERAAANLAELFGDGEAADDVERCPVCGDPADYCQGHGETGDPRGWRKVIAHDHGDHTECHPAGCEAAGTTEHADYPHEVGYLDACEACTSGPCVCCESDSLAPCVSVNCEHPADDGEADDEQRYPEWTERPADGEAIEPDTGRRFGGALAVLVVLAVWFVAGLFAPVSPSAYASPVAEDSPEWNCATMGDHECGPRPAVAPVVPPHCFPLPGRPGNTLWVMLTPSGVAGCTADGR